MKIQSFDDALDFLPNARDSVFQRIARTITMSLQAISEGRRAEQLYNRLTAAGVPASEAVTRVFERTYGSKA